MVNRRGLPQEMLSDNEGNLVGANKELRELLMDFDKNKIISSTTNQGIKWHSILGTADISDEELLTAFSGAEALINSRPLTYQHRM